MAKNVYYPEGLKELRSVRSRNRRLFGLVALFSVFANLLMLTGPLFMLQVYDRVLASRSEETLLALTILVCALYLLYTVLEWARGRVLARAGARFQSDMDARVFRAALRAPHGLQEAPVARTAVQDLESVQRALSSPALLAIFDIPWTPVFAAAIFLFHPYLGLLALAGGVLLVALTLLNSILSRKSVGDANTYVRLADQFAHSVRDNAEVVQGLGIRETVLSRWQKLRQQALGATIGSSDLTGSFSTMTKGLRLFLQSAMLAMGAWLVLQNQLSPGAMIAGSIMMGRALAPIELAIGQWPVVQRARTGWRNLSQLLEELPDLPPRTQLPRPEARLKVENLTAVPPGESHACLRMVSFEVEPGLALGVIGPSASGKSSLARLVTGIWSPAGGVIRLGGASIDNYDLDTLGSYIGYLPQSVAFFDATIAENIARMSENPDPDQVVNAAKRAGAHEMILEQPKGYDTPIRNSSGSLSGGQRQRLGLARALYGDPILLVLDEPNSNLDAVGSNALNDTIRQMKADGGTVIIMAHRPAAIAECDLLLMLDGGQMRAFGPRDEVLRSQVKNVTQIAGNLKATTP